MILESKFLSVYRAAMLLAMLFVSLQPNAQIGADAEIKDFPILLNEKNGLSLKFKKISFRAFRMWPLEGSKTRLDIFPKNLADEAEKGNIYGNILEFDSENNAKQIEFKDQNGLNLQARNISEQFDHKSFIQLKEMTSILSEGLQRFDRGTGFTAVALTDLINVDGEILFKKGSVLNILGNEFSINAKKASSP